MDLEYLLIMFAVAVIGLVWLRLRTRRSKDPLKSVDDFNTTLDKLSPKDGP